jgi:hypothetical protein
LAHPLRNWCYIWPFRSGAWDGDDGIRCREVQMLLIILTLLLLIGSFGLLAGLVYFCESIIVPPSGA